MGVISDSVVSGLSQSVQDLLRKLGTAATTPAGYLGFAFQYLLLALSLFACFQLAAMREDETEQRLETLFALPVPPRALVRRAARCWWSRPPPPWRWRPACWRGPARPRRAPASRWRA